MAVTVTCPACEQSLPVSDEIIGKKIRCKSCQEVFVATAAKVKVGGRSADGEAGADVHRNGHTNGVHKKPALKPQAAKSAGSNKGLLIGGGAALLATAAVMVWALFLRGDGADQKNDQQQAANNNANVPKISLNNTAPNSDTPKSNADAKTETADKPADKPVENAKAKPETDKPATPAATQPVSLPGKPMIAGFADSPKFIPDTIPEDILKKVKRSAVMFRVTTEQGSGEGSGWMAEPGIVVTNAHVVGMVEAAFPPPQSIRVILYPGEKDEKEVTGKLLALDRHNDLAVVQIKGTNLPEPLKISPSSECHDGQRLYTMGFPLGSMLAAAASYGSADKALTTLKVRQSSVAGRVQYKNGGVKRVQIEGGADPGNSGGAIIDTAGHVRCILVEGLPGTNLRFAIPSENAVYLLQGRILEIEPGQAYRGGAGIRLPLKVAIADPMKRINKVTLSVWAGEPGRGVRPATDRYPAPLPGDSPVITADVPYNHDTLTKVGEAVLVKTEVDLPERKDGQVYWFQPKYERSDGSVRWGEAIVADYNGLPVDRRGANLTVKHVAGTDRKIEIGSKLLFGLAPQGFPIPAQGLAIRGELDEKTRLVESNGDAKVILEYKDFHFQDQEMNEAMRERMKDLFDAAKGMRIELTATNRGLIKSPKSNLNQVPQRFRAPMERFNYQIIQALENLAMALPAKDVGPMETWGEELRWTFNLGQNNTKNAVSKVRFTYLGSRTRNGRDEAVIAFEGRTVTGDGNSQPSTAGENATGAANFEDINEAAERRKGIYGILHGSAIVDLQTGLTIVGRSESDIAIDFKVKQKVQNREGNEEEREIDVTYAAMQETTLHREINKGDPKLPVDQYLPELRFSVVPFVGMPDSNVVANPSAGGGTSPDTASAATGTNPLQMKKEVLDKVKAAAALIRCKRDDGGGDGSGWLAEPGIVVTNAHVIGMVDRAARMPLSVEVYFDAGLPTVKKFSAKVLLVDHDNDLAVLELPTKEGLPEPMPIVPSNDLYESQRLFVLGFPMGQRLGAMLGDGIDPLKTELKVRDTSVSGRQDNKKTGFLKYIQVEGGLTPGNSGGALVDMNGAVRCVAVAIMPGTQIGFTIPSEYAARLLTGFPLEMKPLFGYMDGSVAKMPVEIKFGDPMRRVKKVHLDYWVGKPGMPRRATKTAPKPRPDDGTRQSVECTYNLETMKALGEFPMPEVEPGYAYWVQPRFIDGSGKEVWGDAIYFAPDGRPVERRPIKLEAKFKKGGGQIIEVTTDAEYRYVYFGNNVADESHLVVTMAETYLGQNPTNKAQEMVTYKYESLSFGQPRTQNQLIKAILTIINGPQLLIQIRNVISQTLFTKDGVMLPNANVSMQGVDPRVALLAKQFNDQVLQTIQTMSLKMPNKVVQYDESWTQPSNLLIQARNRFEPALFNLTMTYKGVRDRGGRSEAIVEIKGSIARDTKGKAITEAELKTEPNDDNPDPPGEQPKGGTPKGGNPKGKGGPPAKDKEGDGTNMLQRIQALLPPTTAGAKTPLYGDVKGFAYIDVESGHVSYCKLFLDIDVEVMHIDQQTKAKIPVRAGGTIEMELKRRTSVR